MRKTVKGKRSDEKISFLDNWGSQESCPSSGDLMKISKDTESRYSVHLVDKNVKWSQFDI